VDLRKGKTMTNLEMLLSSRTSLNIWYIKLLLRDMLCIKQTNRCPLEGLLRIRDILNERKERARKLMGKQRGEKIESIIFDNVK